MKLRAVRLASVGPFGSPVAIEGLTDGLNVLAERNEFGKSTILRAIRAGFFTRHTTNAGRELAALRSSLGGDPLIELDFEADGKAWRMRKCLAGSRARSTAELTELAHGRLAARGADAEAQLGALIGAEGETAGRFALLFVDQTAALAPLPPDTSAANAINAAIEREINEAGSGAHLRAVRRRVSALLEPLATEKRRSPKAGTAYANAVKRRDALAQSLAIARKEAEALSARFDALETMRAHQRQVDAPAAIAALEHAVVDAQAKLEAAQAAVELHADARVKIAEAARASDALAVFDKLEKELHQLEADASRDEQKHAAAETAAASAMEMAERKRAAAEAVDQDYQHLTELAQLRAQTDADAARASQLQEIEARVAEVHALDAEIARLSAQLADSPATRERLAQVARIERTIETVEARLAAGAARVAIRYEPGAAGRITLAGAPQPEGAAFTVDDDLTLDIPGIGSIRISAGRSADVEADRAALAAHREALVQALATCGLASLADVPTARQEHATIEAALLDARSRHAALAPQGVEALARRCSELAQAAQPGPGTPGQQGMPTAPLPEAATLASRLKESRAMRAAAAAEATAATATAAELMAAAREAGATLAGRRQRREQIARQLPAANARAAERSRLANRMDEASEAAQQALQAARAAAPEAPTSETLARLSLEREAAGKRRSQQAAESQRLAVEIAGAEAALAEAQDQGAGHRLAELEGEHALWARQTQGYMDEVDALALLAEALDAAEAESRTSTLQPLTSRLKPYLTELFDAAHIDFGDKLTVDTLARSGVSEPIDRLSQGTQEQIAVLVRLAFARLLAENGAAAPLILDDALVYSDDARLERMFAILEQAANHHQVIVLTCHQRGFEGLNGHRLALAPWNVGTPGEAFDKHGIGDRNGLGGHRGAA